LSEEADLQGSPGKARSPPYAGVSREALAGHREGQEADLPIKAVTIEVENKAALGGSPSR